MPRSLATVLLCLLLAPNFFGCGRDTPVPSHRFHNTELLFYPRAEAVTLSMMAAEPLLLHAEYGVGEQRTQRTPEVHAEPERVASLTLDNLPPGARVSYQVFVRRPSEASTTAREVHYFSTLHAPASELSVEHSTDTTAEIRFAIAADPHTFQNWAQHHCQSKDTGWRTLDASLTQLANAEQLDFLLIGTDSAMTKCGAGCPSCELRGVQIAQKDAVGLDDAALRYRSVFGPEVYGRVGADLPLLYMLGDHDGERGWASADGNCGYTLDEQAWSREARRRTVPEIPYRNATGDSLHYYAVRTGSLLIVVLDVLNGTTQTPTSADAWSLGPEQLDWLERTLSDSDATFKIVFAEHLLGGLRAPTGSKASICWKGRGGITATTDGSPRGTFLGEQALVQALMEQHGAQLFVSFHDHVVAFGEKLSADGSGSGVGYLIAGQCAGPPLGEVSPAPPPWSNEAWYRDAMDYDGDGVPEFDTGVSGTLEKGLFFVRVIGEQRVELDYLRSDPDPARDGELLLHFVLEPGGPLVPTER